MKFLLTIDWQKVTGVCWFVSMSLLLSAGIFGQHEVKKLKSKLPTFSISVDGEQRDFGLYNASEIQTVELSVHPERPRSLSIRTDAGTLEFRVNIGDHVDFSIEHDGSFFRHKIVGEEFKPDLLKMQTFLAGNAGDVSPKLGGPALALDGGDPKIGGMQALINKARGCTSCGTKVDIVVLSAGDLNKHDPYISTSALERGLNADSKRWIEHVTAMEGVDSIEVLYFLDGPRPDEADSEDVEKKIRKAEVVFFAGGLQCNYVTAFRGTPVQRAVESVYKRGGAVGGSSAGDAIQGEFVFDACNYKIGFVTSAIALADPYDPRISFSGDFFKWKFLEGTMTDQHLVKRDRIGRTFAFLARTLKESKKRAVYGIGSDEEATVVIDKNGVATVVGTANAYFITADHKPEICEKGKPLTYKGFKVWKRAPGEKFDLKNRPKDGYYLVDVVEGKLSRDPY